MDLGYYYDANGNRTEINYNHIPDDGADTDDEFGYDDLNRLIEATYSVMSDPNLTQLEDEEFDYDKLGNRDGVQYLREGTENYSVDSATNRYDSVGGNSLTNDDARNLTGDPKGNEYKYDYENRLVQFDGGLRAHYGYNTT